MGTFDRGVRRLTWPETLRTDAGLSWPVPNRGRQWRAQRSCASPLDAGLGCARVGGRLLRSGVRRGKLRQNGLGLLNDL